MPNVHTFFRKTKEQLKKKTKETDMPSPKSKLKLKKALNEYYKKKQGSHSLQVTHNFS